METGKTKPLYTFDGEEHTIMEWARIKGVDSEALRARLRNGWPIGDALTIPPGGQRQREDLTARCRGCKYLNVMSGMRFCDYAGRTGRPRTAYRGVKVDLCPRRGGYDPEEWLTRRLCRLREEMKMTPEGREALRQVIADTARKG